MITNFCTSLHFPVAITAAYDKQKEDPEIKCKINKKHLELNIFRKSGSYDVSSSHLDH